MRHHNASGILQYVFLLIGRQAEYENRTFEQVDDEHYDIDSNKSGNNTNDDLTMTLLTFCNYIYFSHTWLKFQNDSSSLRQVVSAEKHRAEILLFFVV